MITKISDAVVYAVLDFWYIALQAMRRVWNGPS